MSWILAFSLILMLSLGFSSMAQEFPEPGNNISPEATYGTNVRARELQSNCYHCVAQATENRNGSGFPEDRGAIQKRADAILRGEALPGESQDGTN